MGEVVELIIARCIQSKEKTRLSHVQPSENGAVYCKGLFHGLFISSFIEQIFNKFQVCADTRDKAEKKTNPLLLRRVHPRGRGESMNR